MHDLALVFANLVKLLSPGHKLEYWLLSANAKPFKLQDFYAPLKYKIEDNGIIVGNAKTKE